MPLPGSTPLALDLRTMLGPQLRIQSADTLRRLLAYLATPEQMADFDRSHRRWGQGVSITLQPCRRNLLRIDSASTTGSCPNLNDAQKRE